MEFELQLLSGFWKPLPGAQAALQGSVEAGLASGGSPGAASSPWLWNGAEPYAHQQYLVESWDRERGQKEKKLSCGRGFGQGANSECYIKGQEHELVPALVSVSTERMGLIMLILIIGSI